MLKARNGLKKEEYTWVTEDLGSCKQVLQAHILHAATHGASFQILAQAAVARGTGVPRTESVAWRRLRNLEVA